MSDHVGAIALIVIAAIWIVSAVAVFVSTLHAPSIDEQPTPEPFDQLAADNDIATAHRDFIISAWLNRVQR